MKSEELLCEKPAKKVEVKCDYCGCPQTAFFENTTVFCSGRCKLMHKILNEIAGRHNVSKLGYQGMDYDYVKPIRDAIRNDKVFKTFLEELLKTL